MTINPRMSPRTWAARLVLSLALVMLPTIVMAATYYVSPRGGQGDGTTGAPFGTIQEAVDVAKAGDKIILMSGKHLNDFITVRNGAAGQPIVIQGEKGAIVSGGGEARIAQISHDYIELRNFTIDGHFKAGSSQASFRDKLVYVIGVSRGNGVTGMKIVGMTLRNAGGECIRLRYQARNNEIANNNISNCGLYDFRFGGGGKNGEGIYIGTAPEQLGMFGAPDGSIDHSNGNRVHGNVINTQANECVDIKEGSSGNVVENNKCSGQRDAESGGFDSRGDANIFRFNQVTGSLGAGIRLGGDSSTDGIRNEVYGNTFTGNREGAIRILRGPQGKICENVSSQNGSRPPNDFMKGVDVTVSCSSELAMAAGRQQVASVSGDDDDDDQGDRASNESDDDADDQPATLKCASSRVHCVIGRVEGDARNRIKIFEASDDRLVDRHLILAEVTAGELRDLGALAGKTVLVEFKGLDEKRLVDARVVKIVTRN